MIRTFLFITLLGITTLSVASIGLAGTRSNFTSQASNQTNSFGSAVTFATPTPTPTPTPSPTPIAGVADHIVISEVQISGDGAVPSDDEFIELYNPTSLTIDLSGWSIQRETTGGAFVKKNFVSPANIPAHGYYLITNNSYNGSTVADMSHASFNMASTGTTIFIVNNQTTLSTGTEVSIVDKVGIGSASLNAETSAFTSIPISNSSVERKAYTTSDATSMSGTDSTKGNGYDTDNNSSDFVLSLTSQPQNSASTTEIP